MNKKKKRTPLLPFIAIFGCLIVWMLITNLMRDDVVLLQVQDNAGVAMLETAGKSLVGVFQDGQVAVWDWKNLSAQKANFKLGTDQACVLDARRMAAVSKTGQRVLSVLETASGKMLQTISIGDADQNVRPLVSFDKQVLALIRQDPVSAAGKVLYEFLTVDLDNELLGLPSLVTIQEDSEDLVEFAVASDNLMYAVGSRGETGRIVAMDLDKGRILWDKTYDDTKEFCSVIVSPDAQFMLAGNRNGILYKLDTETGEIIKPIQLLEDGETRPITNDYSVLNLAFSPDGKYYVATINPPAYILETATDKVIHKFSPANKLVSMIAFSPDNKFIATSDIRAGYPIKIWPMPTENE